MRSSSAYDAFDWNSTFTAEAADTYDPVGFGGQFGYYKDGATGLYLLGHRYYYDAGAGRFLTRDPIGYGGGMNLYGFAGNNPVNQSDPSGFAPGNGHISGDYSDLRGKLKAARAGDRGARGEIDIAKYYRSLGKQVRFNPTSAGPTPDLTIDGANYEVKSLEAGTSKANALSRINRSSQAGKYILDIRGTGLRPKDFANATVLLRQNGKTGVSSVVALGERELGPLVLRKGLSAGGKFFGIAGFAITAAFVLQDLSRKDYAGAISDSGALDAVVPQAILLYNSRRHR